MNASQVVFPKITSLQHDVENFNSFEDIEGYGCYYQWDFYFLEKTEIENEDEMTLLKNRMMYTLTGDN